MLSLSVTSQKAKTHSYTIGLCAEKPEQPRHIKPGQNGLAAALTVFVTTALFPSQAQMREVREIWDYHELFMTLKPKSPLYEIISVDWGFRSLRSI